MSTTEPKASTSDGTTTMADDLAGLDAALPTYRIDWLVGEAHRADGSIDRYAKRDGVFQKVATIPPEE